MTNSQKKKKKKQTPNFLKNKNHVQKIKSYLVKKKKRRIGRIAYVQVHMGIFVRQVALFSHFSFLSIVEGKLFGGPGEKTLGPHYLFSFFPTKLNILQILKKS